MSFDEEQLDPHGECAAEIRRLTVELNREQNAHAELQSRCFDGGGTFTSVFDEVRELRIELAQTRDSERALDAHAQSLFDQLTHAQEALRGMTTLYEQEHDCPDPAREYETAILLLEQRPRHE